MKYIINILLLVLGFAVNAADYYVTSSGSGDFLNITQVNAASFSPGDNILFNKGEVFTGTLIVQNSGTSGNPITYGAYGTGAKPIISGFTSVTAWTDNGGNIWESTNAVSTLSTCNMVVINDVYITGDITAITLAQGLYIPLKNGFSTITLSAGDAILLKYINKQ